MTNGHWDSRREKEKQADVLYAQGKTQEADYLLGKQLHPGYVSVAEREEIEREEIKKKLKLRQI
tara:strand:- start:145 stop:336 length:192 start_codon:yes stop_codon:yes gene_type:complete